MSNLSIDDAGWEPKELLKFSDCVRRSLETSSITMDDVRALSAIFSRLLADEKEGDPQRLVKIDLIAYSRLDKLINEMDGGDTTSNVLLDMIISKGISLQHKWHLRFKIE